MKIKINLGVLLFAILFLFTNQFEIYILTMLFALIHEMGHLVCGLILGFKVEKFKIMVFGFLVEFKPEIEDYNKKIKRGNQVAFKKIIIALSGPVVNLFIILSTILYTSNYNNIIIYSNLLIVLFNLIPIYPLDGGRVINNMLILFIGKRKAYKYTNVISNTFIVILTIMASIFILLYKNIAIFIFIIFLWTITIKENKIYNTYNKIYKTIDKKYNYL